MASREKVGTMVAMLAEAYGRATSPVLFEAYFVALRDIADEAIETAGTAALCSGANFMPNPGQLRALALTGGRGVESRVDEAWTTLVGAISQFGSGRSVNFRDALINAIVRFFGGWERVCRMPVEEFEKWFKKDFCAAYMRFMQSGPPNDSGGYLPGENERRNGQWVGVECLRNGKVYELPTPADVESPYVPMLESPPAAKQITRRPENVPRLELKNANKRKDAACSTAPIANR